MSIELVLLGEIMNLSRDAETSLEEFGERVATSPQLASEVVRVSNSALYGMEGKITRLERAVLILGMRTVSDIASALLIKRRMSDSRIGDLGADVLWTHSLETGVCAQLVARYLSLPLDSEAYLAGLLHDLGMLELQAAHEDRYAEVVRRARTEHIPLIDLEREAFNEHHGQRLLECAESWGFPRHLQAAIGFHEEPMNAPEESRTLALLVRVAHVISGGSGEGWTDLPPGPEDQGLLEGLGIGDEDIADIQTLLTERMKELAAVFR